MESHQFCNTNHDFKKNSYMFEKITLFCISICIMKLIKHKTQNNFFSTQIIVLGFPWVPVRLKSEGPQTSSFSKISKVCPSLHNVIKENYDILKDDETSNFNFIW